MSLPAALKKPGIFALRLAAAFILLYPLLTWAAGGYAPALTYLIQKQIELLRPSYSINQLSYVSSGPFDKTIRLNLKVIVDPQNLKSGARIVKGHYPAEIVIIQPLIVLAVLFAWPAGSWSKKLVSLGLGMCGILLALTIDLPFQLIHVIQSSLNGMSSQGYGLKIWVDFLSGGGRLLITMMVIICALIPYRPIKEIMNTKPEKLQTTVGFAPKTDGQNRRKAF